MKQIDETLSGGGAMEVQVADGNQVLDIALIAPAVIGDVLIFLASLYFYLATRENIRISILSVIVSRKLRWRTAHVFGSIESRVSRFLLSVTVLNVAVGVAVTVIAFAFGLPSPLLLGVVAAVLNYVPYLGQAVMIGLLLVVGFATQTELLMIIGPIACYMLVNLIEGQFVFPVFVGRIMTLNPFLIFFSIIFWIWVWGPIGSLMAVPSLIILQSLAVSLIPAKEIAPRRPVRRSPGMSEKDVILENAARAIRENTARRRAEQQATAK
jgi:predicted PurR-regulated permease PerM